MLGLYKCLSASQMKDVVSCKTDHKEKLTCPDERGFGNEDNDLKKGISNNITNYTSRLPVVMRYRAPAYVLY